MLKRTRRTLVLLAVTAVIAGATLAAASPAAAAAGTCEPGAGWPGAKAELAEQVVDLVNAHRHDLGLSPLAVSPTLTASARWKARHMAEYTYLAHSDPGPPVSRGVGQRLDACGYSSDGWGENIAYGYETPAAVVRAWLRSPSHRANIEKPGFRLIGVGAAASSGGVLYWAQNFGT